MILVVFLHRLFKPQVTGECVVWTLVFNRLNGFFYLKRLIG